MKKVLRNRVDRLFAQTTAILADTLHSRRALPDDLLTGAEALSDEFARRWEEIYPRLPVEFQGPMIELAAARGIVLSYNLATKTRRLINEWTAAITALDSAVQEDEVAAKRDLAEQLDRLWNAHRDSTSRDLADRYRRTQEQLRNYDAKDVKVPSPPELPNFDATQIDFADLIRPQLDELRAIQQAYEKEVGEIVTAAWEKSIETSTGDRQAGLMSRGSDLSEFPEPHQAGETKDKKES